MNTLVLLFFNLKNSEKGATMVEYGLLVAVIALVVIGGAAVFGEALSTAFEDWADQLTP